MTQLAEHQICIEACLSANKRINFPELTRGHQPGETITTAAGRGRPSTGHCGRFSRTCGSIRRKYVAVGIPVCLGSDNPLLPNTNIGKENPRDEGVADGFAGRVANDRERDQVRRTSI